MWVMNSVANGSNPKCEKVAKNVAINYIFYFIWCCNICPLLDSCIICFILPDLQDPTAFSLDCGLDTASQIS